MAVNWKMQLIWASHEACCLYLYIHMWCSAWRGFLSFHWVPSPCWQLSLSRKRCLWRAVHILTACIFAGLAFPNIILIPCVFFWKEGFGIWSETCLGNLRYFLCGLNPKTHPWFWQIPLIFAAASHVIFPHCSERSPDPQKWLSGGMSSCSGGEEPGMSHSMNGIQFSKVRIHHCICYC